MAWLIDFLWFACSVFTSCTVAQPTPKNASQVVNIKQMDNFDVDMTSQTLQVGDCNLLYSVSSVFLFDVGLPTQVRIQGHASVFCLIGVWNNLAVEVNPIAFVGAVVNFERTAGTKGPPNMAAIMKASTYGSYAKRAANSGAHVIVFPEGALRGESGELLPVDIPPLGSNMCDDTSFSIQSPVMDLLSCAAYSASVYLVASVDEWVDDRICSAQVVFDSDGTLIARHREYQCADENDDDDDQYFVLPPSDLKIGLLLTRDLAYSDTVNSLISAGILHYALSFSMNDTHPFGTSLQVQLWWSFSKNVVLMAAGLTDDASHNPRSSVFAGRSNVRCLPKPEDKGIIVAEIPREPKSPPVCLSVDWMKHFTRKLRFSVFDGEKFDDDSRNFDYDYDYGMLKAEHATMTPLTDNMSGKWTPLCQFDFCCAFYTVNAASDSQAGYRLMIFSGPSIEFGSQYRVDRCGLVKCDECAGQDVSTFVIQSNRAGLTPNVLTDGVSPSPRIRFFSDKQPRMMADNNVRSVLSAVLQSVKPDNGTAHPQLSQQKPTNQLLSDPQNIKPQMTHPQSNTPQMIYPPNSRPQTTNPSNSHLQNLNRPTTNPQNTHHPPANLPNINFAANHIALPEKHQDLAPSKPQFVATAGIHGVPMMQSMTQTAQKMQDGLQHNIQSLQHTITDEFGFGRIGG